MPKARSETPKRGRAKPSPSPPDDQSANADGAYPYMFFYGHSPVNPLGVLSQWSATSFVDPDVVLPAGADAGGLLDPAGVHFLTAEHYMMYHKAILFCPSMAEDVLRAPGPREAKSIGRSIPYFDPKIWNENADTIVERANYLKFSQNAEAWAVLRATSGPGPAIKTCVEASPRDRIWGIGFSAVKARGRESEWGTNRLGKALTRVREKLIAEERDDDDAA